MRKGFEIKGEVLEITRPKGIVKMDLEDMGLLGGWTIEFRNGYAVLRKKTKAGRVRLALHRLIMSAPQGFEVDHINHNRLDNRKANLRLCTRSENSRNTQGQSTRTNPYKGVMLHKPYIGKEKPWRAYTRIKGKRIWLGYHSTAEAAAVAYNNYARKVFGEFACLNEVPA